MKYLKIPDDSKGLLRSEEMRRFKAYVGGDIKYHNETKMIEISHSESIREVRIKDALSALIYGFDFSDAYSIVDENNKRLELISIDNHTRNKKELERQKSRIIGENGKTKKTISKVANVGIRIYRDKVAILGSIQDVIEARKQVLKLISGCPSSRVYENLESYRARKKERKMRISYTKNPK